LYVIVSLGAFLQVLNIAENWSLCATLSLNPSS